MIDLYDRFGLATDREAEISRFRTKLENLLEISKFGIEVLDDKEDDITWRFANYLGEKYDHPSYAYEKMNFMLATNLPFNEFLYRLQIILELLWVSRKNTSVSLASLIGRYFDESKLDLGYFVKIYKTKSPQILPAKNKHQQQKIEGAIDQLEAKPKKYSAAIEHYESGIKELLTAKTKAQLKDVVEDMSTSCDSVVKALFNDGNLGFKHLFKDKRWEHIKLNDIEKRIFGDLNNLIDQIKHDVIKKYSKENIETIVYLASTFIERVAK